MEKIILPIAITTCALAAQFAPAAQPPEVKEIMSKPLTDIPGKEGLVLTVIYPPGGGDEIHRHNAHAFVYVLESSIVMQLGGAEAVTLKAGEGFYEGPNDFSPPPLGPGEARTRIYSSGGQQVRFVTSLFVGNYPLKSSE